MSRTPLIAGNWKMHGSRGAVDEFAAQMKSSIADIAVDLLVCAPFVYLERLSGALARTPIAVGGENLAGEVDAGAFTGEVNGAMLRDVGCTHVIVGHSERRALFGESDTIVARKIAAAATAGLQPILCVGETLEERDAGETEQVLARQLRAVLSHSHSSSHSDTLAVLTVAYEPVWAIGTGRSATPEQAQAMHAFIRNQIALEDATLSRSMRLLYGGSVKLENAAELFAGADVDGALVGGASLKAASFLDIARAAA